MYSLHYYLNVLLCELYGNDCSIRVSCMNLVYKCMGFRGPKLEKILYEIVQSWNFFQDCKIVNVIQ